MTSQATYLYNDFNSQYWNSLHPFTSKYFSFRQSYLKLGTSILTGKIAAKSNSRRAFGNREKSFAGYEEKKCCEPPHLRSRKFKVENHIHKVMMQTSMTLVVVCQFRVNKNIDPQIAIDCLFLVLAAN